MPPTYLPWNFQDSVENKFLATQPNGRLSKICMPNLATIRVIVLKNMKFLYDNPIKEKN